MDNKKRAQAVWAVVLALLGLLAFGSGLLPSSPTSPSPSPNGPGTGSGTASGSGSGSGTGSGSGSGSGTGSGSGSGSGSDAGSGSGSSWSSGSGSGGDTDTGDTSNNTGDSGGWQLPGNNDEVDPGTDSPTGTTPEDRPNEDTGPDLVEDEQDRFPSDDEENAEHNEEFFEGTEDFEDATTYGDSDEPVPEFNSIEDAREYAARSSAPQSGAVDAGAASQPIHDSGTGLFEYARENPTNAAIIVGGSAALAASGTGLVLSAAGYTTAISTAQAASLAAVGVPASTYENANAELRELVDVEEETSSTGSSGNSSDGDDGASSDPWEDSGGDSAPEQGDDWQPDDGGHSPGPDIDPNDGSNENDDSGNSSDPWEDSGGEQAPEQDNDWQPDDGGHSPGPGIDPDDDESGGGGSSGGNDDANDSGNDDAEESDLPFTPEPDPTDSWMPGTGGHSTGVM